MVTRGGRGRNRWPPPSEDTYAHGWWCPQGTVYYSGYEDGQGYYQQGYAMPVSSANYSSQQAYAVPPQDSSNITAMAHGPPAYYSAADQQAPPMYYAPYYGAVPGAAGAPVPMAPPGCYPGWQPYVYPVPMMVASHPYGPSFPHHGAAIVVPPPPPLPPPAAASTSAAEEQASGSCRHAGGHQQSRQGHLAGSSRKHAGYHSHHKQPWSSRPGLSTGFEADLDELAIANDDDASDAGSDNGSEDFSPNFPITPDASSWSSLTVGILQNIMIKLGDTEVKYLRLVCRHWRAVVDQNLEALTPSSMKSKLIVTRFPNLKVLHLTNCANIRNRDLLILSRSGLRLHTLTLGDDTNKPWVTNKGLSCIAKITTLTCLNLQDCNSVTNNGLQSLNHLKALSVLSLKGCRKLTNFGLEALQKNTALTSLNLSGCLRIADKGLMPLTALNLVSLQLGSTRVRDEGLAYLAQITSLKELHFCKEEMTDAGVKQLSSLSNLQSLALRDCCEVSGDALSHLIPQLPSLVSLDLYRNLQLDDSQLAKCMEFLGSVTFLDLRGTFVTEEGINQLTRLNNLQKLCLAPNTEPWCEFLCVVSNLTQLTSLTINKCTLISFSPLESLRHLKLLRELDLSDDDHDVPDISLIHKEPVNDNAIEVMATITTLTSIDLSRRPVHEQHLNVLAERLPRLRTLVVVGCPVVYNEVQALRRRFPELVIHRKPLNDISCSSSDHGL